jgi:hypothetical protein
VLLLPVLLLPVLPLPLLPLLPPPFAMPLLPLLLPVLLLPVLLLPVLPPPLAPLPLPPLLAHAVNNIAAVISTAPCFNALFIGSRLSKTKLCGKPRRFGSAGRYHRHRQAK